MSYPCLRRGCKRKKRNGRCTVYGECPNPKYPPEGEDKCKLFTTKKPAPAGGERNDE